MTVGWRRKRFEANDGHVGTYICVSAKRTYPTRAAAEEALAEVSQRPPRGETPVRAYRCDLCPFWHLTSKPLSHSRELIERSWERKYRTHPKEIP